MITAFLNLGRFGVVHRVNEKSSNIVFAAKKVRCIMQRDRDKVLEEVSIMNRLRHPKLLQLAAAFDSAKEMTLVME